MHLPLKAAADALHRLVEQRDSLALVDAVGKVGQDIGRVEQDVEVVWVQCNGKSMRVQRLPEEVDEGRADLRRDAQVLRDLVL